jgi:hypothetical protein
MNSRYATIAAYPGDLLKVVHRVALSYKSCLEAEGEVISDAGSFIERSSNPVGNYGVSREPRSPINRPGSVSDTYHFTGFPKEKTLSEGRAGRAQRWSLTDC